MTAAEMERALSELQRQVKDIIEVVQTLMAQAGRETSISTVISDGEQAGTLRDVFAFGGEDGSDPEYDGQLCLRHNAWMVDEQGRAARILMVYSPENHNVVSPDDDPAATRPLHIAGWGW